MSSAGLCKIESNFAIRVCGLSVISMRAETSVPMSVPIRQTGARVVFKYRQPQPWYDPLFALDTGLVEGWREIIEP
jgi:hypothetical protein